MVKHTLSNFQKALVTHMHLDLDVSFDDKRITGTVTYDVTLLNDGVPELVLDTNHLQIRAVRIAGKEIEDWSLQDRVEPFGQALHIPLSTAEISDLSTRVEVQYSTTSEGAALQWLKPIQTLGKSHPFVFAQCQAIHARSFFPCQDTPRVKTTYSASVSVPAPLRACMSALPDGELDPIPDEGSRRTFHFKQPVPTPSYLIALGAGNISYRDLGPRSRIYSEPEHLDAVSWEFAEVETFLEHGERLVGPYVWSRYDMLVLPPSFPYGGMENTNLTFLTPTLIAGDRSLVDVVVHELAHSWAGNLVTNDSWESFALNEGLTMFLQRKIVASLHGDYMFNFDAASGQVALDSTIDLFMRRGQKGFTRLVPTLDGIDPDEAFSSIPYEKGFAMFCHLESVVGKDAFAKFMFDFYQTWKFASISMEHFRDYCIQYFKEGRHMLPRVSTGTIPPVHDGSTGKLPLESMSYMRSAAQSLLTPTGTTNFTMPPSGATQEQIDVAAKHSVVLDESVFPWRAWLYGEGDVPHACDFHTPQREAIVALAKEWFNNPGAAAAKGTEPVEGWSAAFWIAFLEELFTLTNGSMTKEPKAILSPAALYKMGVLYSIDKSKNAEILNLFHQLCVRSDMPYADEAAIAFLHTVGRMKFVRPVVQSLLRNAKGRVSLQKALPGLLPSLHPICTKGVQIDVENETKVAPEDISSCTLIGADLFPSVTAPLFVATDDSSAQTGFQAEGKESTIVSSFVDDDNNEYIMVEENVEVPEGELEGADGEEDIVVDEDDEDVVETDDSADEGAPKKKITGFGVSVMHAQKKRSKKQNPRQAQRPVSSGTDGGQDASDVDSDFPGVEELEQDYVLDGAGTDGHDDVEYIGSDVDEVEDITSKLDSTAALMRYGEEEDEEGAIELFPSESSALPAKSKTVKAEINPEDRKCAEELRNKMLSEELSELATGPSTGAASRSLLDGLWANTGGRVVNSLTILAESVKFRNPKNAQAAANLMTTAALLAIGGVAVVIFKKAASH